MGGRSKWDRSGEEMDGIWETKRGARVQTRRGRNTGTVAKLEARSNVQGRPCSGSEAQDPIVFVVDGEAQVTLSTGSSTCEEARIGSRRGLFAEQWTSCDWQLKARGGCLERRANFG